MLTYHMSSDIIEPIRDNEVFNEAVRNVTNSRKQPKGWFSKDTKVLMHLSCIYPDVLRSSLPFWPFFLLVLAFLTAPLMSSMSLNGFTRYPDMWEVHNNLSLSHNLEKMHQDCRLLWKSHIWLFQALMDVPDKSWEVLIVSDWFHKVPWHVRSPEQLKSLP